MGNAPHLTHGYLPVGDVAAKSTGVSCNRNRSKRGGRGGFTLVEIMIVVVIIGLLAAIAIPTFSRVKLKSQAARMANDFRQYESAFQRYSLEIGSLPGATGLGLIPTGMSGYLPDSYTQASPLGGQYLWSGPSQNVVLSGTYATDETMEMVDKVLDDGDLTTGDFTKIAAATFGYKVH